MDHAETACRALIRCCLDNGYTPIWPCSAQNPGSQALAQKVGFRITKLSPYHFFIAKESLWRTETASILSGTHYIPELIATAAVVLLHLWKRQMLLSIAGGTVLYMLLLQFVF
jgi:hypothetical protein